ncbi:MAG: AAA family ATPase [Blastocatellia bacterium]
MNERPAKLTVTIARQMGSGGSYIGRLIADQLGLRYIDREVLHRAAEALGLAADEVAAREERVSPLFERLFGVFGFGQPDGLYTPPPLRQISDKQLFDKETEIMKSIASEGDCVIIGRGAVHVLRRHPAMFNVLCIAPLRFRVERVMKLYNLADPQTARAIVQESDQMRKRCFTKMTGYDWTCADNYHLCIDTSLLPLAEATDLIISIIQHKMSIA